MWPSWLRETFRIVEFNIILQFIFSRHVQLLGHAAGTLHSSPFSLNLFRLILYDIIFSMRTYQKVIITSKLQTNPENIDYSDHDMTVKSVHRSPASSKRMLSNSSPL